MVAVSTCKMCVFAQKPAGAVTLGKFVWGVVQKVPGGGEGWLTNAS